MNSELMTKYRAEVARLDGEIAHYDQLWERVPYFAWTALFAPIAGFVWGFAWAFVALLVAVSLVGVRGYLVAMRKSENVWTRERLLREMGESPAGAIRTDHS